MSTTQSTPPKPNRAARRGAAARIARSAGLSADAQRRLAEMLGRIDIVQETEIDLDWDYVVKKWFLAGETAIVYAPSNLGKSTFVIDLARAIVAGEPWHGYKTRRGVVLYIAAESAISIIERAKPLVDPDDAPFVVLDDRVDLFGSPDDIDALATLCERIAARAGEQVVLIVIDTLTLCIGAGDENSNADAVRITRAAARLAEMSGAHVLMVHHTGKDRSSGARGASGLIGNIDTAIELATVEADGENLVRAIQAKQRRMPKTGSITFRIVSETLGHDSDNEERTVSAIEVVAAGDLETFAATAASARASALLEVIDQLAAAAGSDQEAEGFTASEVAEASYEQHGRGLMKPESWQKAVRKELNKLATAGIELVVRGRGRYGRPILTPQTLH